MLVKATNKYKELNVKDKILDKIPEAGEEFEVTEERFKELTETNQYNTIFVEAVTDSNTKNTTKETKGKKK